MWPDKRRPALSHQDPIRRSLALSFSQLNPFRQLRDETISILADATVHDLNFGQSFL
jgi:hypothetical protein